MKAVFFIGGGFRGEDTVVRSFPSIDFASVGSVEELARELPDAEILLTANGVYGADTAKLVRDAGKALRWIHFKTSGVDKVVKLGLPTGILITNSPGLSASCHVAHAMGMLLVLTRCFRRIDADRTLKRWTRNEMGQHMVSLVGKTMVIVGFGAMGQEMARYAKTFGMKVVVVSRQANPGPHVDEVVGRESLRQVLPQADVVSMCAALTADTRHILGPTELACMKPSAYVVNVARGELVDEMAMADALLTGRLAGAALDVFSDEPPAEDHPFWVLDNVVMTPHVSGAGFDSNHKATEIMLDNLKRYLAKQELQFLLGEDQLRQPEASAINRRL